MGHRRRSGFAAVLAAASMGGLAVANPVAAAPRAAPAWYVTSASTSTAYDHGCNTGRGHFRGLVALFLGGPRGTSGTILPFSDQFASLNKDAAVARAFARGYARCLSKHYKDKGYRIALSLNTNTAPGTPT